MWRRPSKAGADNGWRIMSEIDASEYLNARTNWQIVDYNDVCYIEPVLVGIWDFGVGPDLEIVRGERGITIYCVPARPTDSDREFLRSTSILRQSAMTGDPSPRNGWESCRLELRKVGAT